VLDAGCRARGKRTACQPSAHLSYGYQRRRGGRREVTSETGACTGIYSKFLIMLGVAALAAGAGACGSAAPQPGTKPAASRACFISRSWCGNAGMILVWAVVI
jgi:hypothetical protein